MGVMQPLPLIDLFLKGQVFDILGPSTPPPPTQHHSNFLKRKGTNLGCNPSIENVLDLSLQERIKSLTLI